MTATNFPACLTQTLKWEGGYVDHPRDPGGATNLGITRATLARHRGRAVSKQDVKNLTKGEAAEIYSKDYWRKVRGDNLPDGLDLVAFDGGVNSGPSRGIRWLQKGLGVAADGKMGPVTLEAASSVTSGVTVVQRASSARMGFLKKLGTWSSFGRGWARRVADTEAAAVAMYTRSVAVIEQAAKGAAKSKAKDNAGAVGSVGTGGVGSQMVDMPNYMVWGVVGVAVLIAIILMLNAAQNGRRAAAYRAKQLEMQNG